MGSDLFPFSIWKCTPRCQMPKINVSPSHGINGHPKILVIGEALLHNKISTYPFVSLCCPASNQIHCLSRHMPMTGPEKCVFWAHNSHTFDWVLEQLLGLTKEDIRKTNLWGLKIIVGEGDYMCSMENWSVWFLVGLYKVGFCHTYVTYNQTVPNASSSQDIHGRCPVRSDD